MDGNEHTIRQIHIGSFVKTLTVFSIILSLFFSILIVGYLLIVKKALFFYSVTLTFIQSLMVVVFAPAVIGLDTALLSLVFCLIFNLSLRISGGIKITRD